VCGPAAFFYCLQKDRPDVYAQAARELWRYGKTRIGNLKIEPVRDAAILQVIFMTIFQALTG
jgi:hypothetical protein